MMEYKFQVMRRLQSFNDTTIRDDDTLRSCKARRMEHAAALLGRMGENVSIEPGLFVIWGCTIFVGNDVYVNRK